jgi:hypothetical protein
MCQINVLPSTVYAFNRNYVTEYSNFTHTGRRISNFLWWMRQFLGITILCAFAQTAEGEFFFSWWSSVYPQVSGLLRLDEFSCNLLLETLIKICPETTNFFQIGQKYRHFIWRFNYFCEVDFCLKNFVTRQQFQGNTFLLFHGNSEDFILWTATCRSTT